MHLYWYIYCSVYLPCSRTDANRAVYSIIYLRLSRPWLHRSGRTCSGCKRSGLPLLARQTRAEKPLSPSPSLRAPSKPCSQTTTRYVSLFCQQPGVVCCGIHLRRCRVQNQRCHVRCEMCETPLTGNAFGSELEQILELAVDTSAWTFIYLLERATCSLSSTRNLLRSLASLIVVPVIFGARRAF